jgi:hypothetical protein
MFLATIIFFVHSMCFNIDCCKYFMSNPPSKNHWYVRLHYARVINSTAFNLLHSPYDSAYGSNWIIEFTLLIRSSSLAQVVKTKRKLFHLNYVIVITVQEKIDHRTVYNSRQSIVVCGHMQQSRSFT